MTPLRPALVSLLSALALAADALVAARARWGRWRAALAYWPEVVRRERQRVREEVRCSAGPWKHLGDPNDHAAPMACGASRGNVGCIEERAMVAPPRKPPLPLHFAAVIRGELYRRCVADFGPYTRDRDVFDRAGLARCPECVRRLVAT